MSLFAADTGKLESGILFAHSLWFIPAQLLFTSIMIYRLLGLAAFSSFAVILAGIPLQGWIMSMISRNREVIHVTHAHLYRSSVMIQMQESKCFRRCSLDREY